MEIRNNRGPGLAGELERHIVDCDMSPTANKPVPNELREPTGPLGDLGTKPACCRGSDLAIDPQKNNSGDCRDRDSQLQPAA